MDVNWWIVCFVLCWSEFDSNDCKTFWLNQTNFGEKFKDFIRIMTHSEVNWCIRLIYQFKTVISRSIQKSRLHDDLIWGKYLHDWNEGQRVGCKRVPNTSDCGRDWREYFSVLHIFSNFGLNCLVKLDVS